MEDEKGNNQEAIELAKLLFDPSDPLDYVSMIGGPGIKGLRTAYKVSKLPPNVRAKMLGGTGGGGGPKKIDNPLQARLEKNRRLRNKLSPEDRKAYDGYQKAADDALIEEQNLPSIGNIDYSNKKSVMEAIAIQERGNVLRQQRKDFLEQAEALLKSVDDELPLQFGGPVSPLLYNF